jgi:hypothetical protein
MVGVCESVRESVVYGGGMEGKGEL